MTGSSPSLAFNVLLLLVTNALIQQTSSTALLGPSNERSKAAISAPNGFDAEDESSLEESGDNRYFSQQQDESKYDEKEEETAMKRRWMELLLRLATDANIKGTHKNKRTCKVNLGGNCATEEALSMADHWHFLNSAMSPGRRRRREAPKALVQPIL